MHGLNSASTEIAGTEDNHQKGVVRPLPGKTQRPRISNKSVSKHESDYARRPTEFLDLTATRLKAKEADIAKLDTKLVENDIAARRIEADIGWAFAQVVDEIGAALKAAGKKLNVDQWCKQVVGVEISTMRRRKRLYAHWKTYESERRKAGQCGQSGLLLALSLIRDAKSESERTGTRSPVRSSIATESTQATATNRSIHGCQFITGDALIELPKLEPQSVHTAITSPPYWPAKRAYAGIGIGFEETLEEYVAHLVAVFQEVKRVLRDDGTLWINIDDAYSKPSGVRHGDPNAPRNGGVWRQDSTYIAAAGNLLFIPARLAMAMQADGWVCRAEIIWQKLGGGRPDSVTNRPVRDYETVLMFAKARTGYHYDPDPHRIPLVKPFSRLGRQKNGLNRRDTNRTKTVFGNPMGRLGGSVWEIAPASGYRGSHPATMPEELVRRCLAASCPENGLVLDPFGGAATTALVALRLGFQAISIEINPEYTQEAEERIRSEFAAAPDKLAAD